MARLGDLNKLTRGDKYLLDYAISIFLNTEYSINILTIEAVKRLIELQVSVAGELLRINFHKDEIKELINERFNDYKLKNKIV